MASHNHPDGDFLVTGGPDKALFDPDSEEDMDTREEQNGAQAHNASQEPYVFYPDPKSALHTDNSVVLGKRRSDESETTVGTHPQDIVLASSSSVEAIPRQDVPEKRRHIGHEVSAWRPTSRLKNNSIRLSNQFRVQEKLMLKQAAMFQQTQDALNALSASQQQMVAERSSLLERLSRLEIEKETIQVW